MKTFFPLYFSCGKNAANSFVFPIASSFFKKILHLLNGRKISVLFVRGSKQVLVVYVPNRTKPFFESTKSPTYNKS